MHKTSILRVCGGACFAATLTFAFPAQDGVRIQFLGTGHPNIASARPRMQAAITVDVGGDRWLLDAGAGAVARLYETERRPPRSVISSSRISTTTIASTSTP